VVVGAQIVAIVGGQKRNAGLLGEAEEIGKDGVLLGDSLILQFQEEVLGSEDLLVEARGPLGFLLAPRQQELGNLAS